MGTVLQGTQLHDSVERLVDDARNFVHLVSAAPNSTDFDNDVVNNNAALWPQLDPKWKYPNRWWMELATADGRQDCDWSHLAARYWPERADAKGQEDPSRAVAHGCSWKYHSERAYKWELRLQEEIEDGFTIDEAGSAAAREAWLQKHPDTAQELRVGEWKRRQRKAKKEGGEATPVPGVAVDGEPG